MVVVLPGWPLKLCNRTNVAVKVLRRRGNLESPWAIAQQPRPEGKIQKAFSMAQSPHTLE